MSSKRAETRVQWRAAVRGGRIDALETHVYYAGGAFKNYTDTYCGLIGIAGMATYEIPHYRANLHCMRINRAPTGPLRGAGIPQGLCFGFLFVRSLCDCC